MPPRRPPGQSSRQPPEEEGWSMWTSSRQPPEEGQDEAGPSSQPSPSRSPSAVRIISPSLTPPPRLPSPAPPEEDRMEREDEEMVDAGIDLMEYLDQQDNPDPGPNVFEDIFGDISAVAEQAANLPPHENFVVIPQDDYIFPPPGQPHDHMIYFCPFMWKPPSLKPIFRQPGRRDLLEQAGVLNFIKYNYPRVRESFLQYEFRDIRWSEELEEIVVEPSAPVNGRRIPRKIIDRAFIQRIWPGLPSMLTHDTLEKPLYQAPIYSSRPFFDELDRFFFISPYVHNQDLRTGKEIMLDYCFNMPLYRFLLRITFLFGWRGYSYSMPVYYLPMALLTFVTGKCYPWADLIMWELERDVRYRRQCPRMIHVWKVIWNYVLAEDGEPPEPRPEKRYNYVNWLQQCRDLAIPLTRPDGDWHPHYHMHEVSRFLPESYRATVHRGACPDESHVTVYPYPEPSP